MMSLYLHSMLPTKKRIFSISFDFIRINLAYLIRVIKSFIIINFGNDSGEYICEFLVLFHRGENKQAAEQIDLFKHEIV